jgi:hypothetical protein
MNEQQFKQLLNVLTGIKEEIGEAAYNINELKGQFEVNTRMYPDTIGNVHAELVDVLNKKFEDDFNNHLNKN